MIGFLFAGIDKHIPTIFRCSGTGCCNYARFTCVHALKIMSSVNVWSLIDVSLNVQMFLYREKRRRGESIPGVCQYQVIVSDMYLLSCLSVIKSVNHQHMGSGRSSQVLV